jgi:hypothetical protein
MKKAIFLSIILIGFVFVGCATDTAIREEIRMKSTEKGNVFEELKDSDSIPGKG